MAYASPTLLFEDAEPVGLEPRHGTGLLPAQHLKALIEQSREIRAAVPIEADQLQPASLDLRLGARVSRVRASFSPHMLLDVSTTRATSKGHAGLQ